MTSSIIDADGIFSQYGSSLTGTFDELYSLDRKIRPQYSYLAEVFNRFTPTEIDQRIFQLRQIIRDNGVRYNVAGEDRGRTWQVDPIPLLLSSEEFKKIERGLLQRAQLFNEILFDLYGERRLLKERIISPAMLFCHGGFLRQCIETIHSNRALAYYSADIVRTQNGDFMVHRDMFQAVSGAGYALENRLATSRVFSSLYRDAQVHRLANYFRRVRISLAALAPDKNNANVVVLTPGEASETYFEQAFAAAYLGYTLARAQDLMVQRGRVYIRAIDGVKQVDVIVRRVDDIFSDPLELKGDSLLGVPGLLEAVRRKNVFVANPVGSGALENSALNSVLNDICKFFFKEELHMKMRETLWLGDKASCQRVLENLTGFIVKPINSTSLGNTIFTEELDSAGAQSLTEKIVSRGEYFVAQQRLPVTTCPILTGTGIQKGKYILRTYGINSENDYQFMPGGMAIVSTSLDDKYISHQHGAISKDVWVLATEPERPVTLLSAAGHETFNQPVVDEVPASVAENLFWIGRYAERSENLARILRRAVQYTVDSRYPAEYASLFSAITHLTATYPGFVSNDRQLFSNPEPELSRLTVASNDIGTLAFNVHCLVQSSGAVRDRLADDALRAISQLDDLFQIDFRFDYVLDLLENLVFLLSALTAMFNESMTQNAGWVMLDLGRRIERAVLFCRLITSIGSSSILQQDHVIETLLEVNNVKNTFRRRFKNQAQIENVLDLLIFEDKNPRSLSFQVKRISSGLRQLAITSEDDPLFQLSHKLEKTLQQRIFAGEDYASLENFCQQVMSLLTRLSDQLDSRYFIADEPQTQIGTYYG